MQHVEAANEFEVAFRLGLAEHCNHSDTESVYDSDNETVGDECTFAGDYDFASDIDCNELVSTNSEGIATDAPSAIIVADTLQVSPPEHEDVLRDKPTKRVQTFRHSPYRKGLAASSTETMCVVAREVAASSANSGATAPHFLEWVEDEHLAAAVDPVVAPEPKSMCCYFKLKGKCKMGSRCWYGHDGNLYTPCHYGSGCKAGHATLTLMARGATATHDSYAMSAALLAQSDTGLSVRVGW